MKSSAGNVPLPIAPVLHFGLSSLIDTVMPTVQWRSLVVSNV